MPRGVPEGLTALGALLLTYALQPYVYPPTEQWRTPLAVFGAVVSLIGIAMFFLGRRSGDDAATATRQAVAGGDGDGARQATNVSGSGHTVTQAGRDAIGTQYVLHPPTPSAAPFDGVPHLMWSSATVVPVGQGYEVHITCKNAGKRTAHVMLGSQVHATAGMQGLEGQEEEVVGFVDFSVPGFISPVSEGYIPFVVKMHCKRASALPQREVTWRVVYTDDDGAAMGFITECSLTVTSYIGRWAIADEPPPALDNSSREERHDSYRRYMASRKGGTGGTGSTGPRRTDW